MSIAFALASLALSSASLFPELPPLPPATAVRTMPLQVKAVYATSYTAHGPLMNSLRALLRSTELNAIVINTKEPSGPKLDPALTTLVAALQEEGAWVIGRQVVLQDDDAAARHPEFALTRADGRVWRDRGGHTWVDPASPAVWRYNLDIAKQTLALGFDEINLDYVRFPTDGDVKAIRYPTWNGTTPKEDIITSFAAWFRRELRAAYPEAKLSADVFGYSFLKDNDVGMGQRVAKLAPNLDVIAPMIYPSHYASGNFKFANPAEHPYEVAYQTLAQGKLLLVSSPRTLVRPWFQDFNLGATYTASMVQAQLKALADTGYQNGWMLWNPHNVYTAGALKPEVPAP